MRRSLPFLLLALVCSPSVRAQADSAPALKQRALALEQAHDLQAAEAAWRRVVASSPSDAEAQAHLGLVCALEGNYTDAVPAYRKALELRPGFPGVSMNLGLALFKQAHLAEAIQPLEAAAKQSPSDPRPRLLLGMAYFGTGQYPAAIPNLRAGLDLTPTNLELRLTLAQSCLWARDYACALEQDQLILKQDPNSAQADMITGEALDAKGDSAAAVAQFRAAELAAPNTPNVHFGLGYLLWKQGQFAEAAEEFRQELKLDPSHIQALTYLGDIAIKNNDWTAAKDALSRAAAQPGAVRLTFLDLGILEANDRQYPKAEQDFKHAIAMAPDDPDAHYRLARLSQTVGNTAQAAAEMAQVRQLHKKKDEILVQQISPQAAAAQPSSAQP